MGIGNEVFEKNDSQCHMEGISQSCRLSTTECGTEVFVFCFLLSTTFQEYSVIFLLSITEIQVEGTPASTDAENDNESKTSCSCNFSLVPNECLSYP